MDFTPLDAVITGCAFEEATTAIGVLEQGAGGPGKLSAEMVCTLDNFVQALLFNERVFVSYGAWVDQGRIIPGGVAYRGGPEGQKQLYGAGFVTILNPKYADPQALSAQVEAMLKPVDPRKTNWFVVSCAYAKAQYTLNQEMVTLDGIYLEDAIQQAGVEKLKPVFPGEHLYLGLRQRRMGVPRITQTMSDAVGLRLRGGIRERMAKLNVFVAMGAPLIPELPTIYVNRILSDCASGRDFVPVLLEIRNSPALRRLRAWMAKCAERLRSPDLEERAKAADAWQKFLDYPLEQAIDRTEAGLGVLNVALDLVKADVLGLVGDVVGPVAKYFLTSSFHGLRNFSGGHADQARLDAFLTATFGDRFDRGEMHLISNFLKLPANLKDWAADEAELTVGAGRIYLDRDPLARSFMMSNQDPNVLSDIVDDFNAKWAKAKAANPPNGPS